MKLILIGVVFSVVVWWIIDETASPETAQKLHRGAATVFWWMVAIFVVGGVIGLLSFGWDHLGKKVLLYNNTKEAHGRSKTRYGRFDGST
jgi:hypothetical protein